ncbi:pilin [Grimontia hollisae]|uniref:pilin n=1 Tax=Grimontia hollisae TaxID=673 RepID=UPI0023DB2E87|nr:pilin [Grimontia hollisae]MDF2183325.1 pilin [Grimontia hollisae]
MKKQQGFSLVELMIVVAVIGVLTAVALPAYQNYVKKSEAGAALATLNALKTNAEDYIATNGSFPTTVANLGTVDSIFKYGTLSIGADVPDLIITFDDADSSLNATDTIKITRDDNGSWSCATSGFADPVKPKGCS